MGIAIPEPTHYIGVLILESVHRIIPWLLVWIVFSSSLLRPVYRNFHSDGYVLYLHCSTGEPLAALSTWNTASITEDLHIILFNFNLFKNKFKQANVFSGYYIGLHRDKIKITEALLSIK